MNPINSYNGDYMAFEDFTKYLYGAGPNVRLEGGASYGKRLAIGSRTDSGYIMSPTVRNPVEDPLGYINTLENLATAQVSGDRISSNTTFARMGPEGGTDTQEGITTDVDWRARLRPKGGRTSKFWFGENGESPDPAINMTNDPLLRPLWEAGGLVWQYTPNIFVTGRANYNAAEFYGSNYPFVTYTNSTPPVLTVTADFSANTVEEARYMLAIFHFVRVATKSFYGDTAVANGMYGTPPPVMLFEYLGDHGFNAVPVVLTDYQYSLEDGIDYVPVKTGVVGEETTYVPTFTNIALTLQPSYTPHKLRRRFDLNTFTTGKSYKDGFI